MLGKQLLNRTRDVEGDDEEEQWKVNTVGPAGGGFQAFNNWDPFAKIVFGTVVTLLILFPYICIPILFGLIADVEKDSYYTTATLVTSGLAVTPSSSSSSSFISPSAGLTSSLSSTGGIQVGGGTSIYRGITSINTTCPSYLGMEAVSPSLYLVYYANEDSSSSTLKVAQYSSAGGGAEVVSSTSSDYYFYKLAGLSKETGLFVGICQDYSLTENTGYVVAGVVQEDGLAITFGTSTNYLDSAADESVNPLITRLSSTSFALTYFCGGSLAVCTRYGYTDASSLSVVLSDSVQFVQNPSYTVEPCIVGLSATQYVLLYYDGSVYPSTTEQYEGSGPLTAMLATVQAGVADAPALSATVALNSSSATFYLKGARLSNQTLVVAYADPSSGYSVVSQVLRVGPDLSTGEPSIVFGSTWAATSGRALEELMPYEYMDLDIAATSDSKGFTLLYSDVSNYGSMTTVSASVTTAGQIVRSSPAFVLTGPMTSGLYAWGSLAAGVTSSSGTQTGILTSFASTDCAVASSVSFSMMEVLPRPMGVVTSLSGAAATVAVSGVLCSAAFSGFEVGKAVYTNTYGETFTGSSFFGSCERMSEAQISGSSISSSSSSSSSSSDSVSSSSADQAGSCAGYVYDPARNALVSEEGLLGPLVSASCVLLSK